LNDISLLILNSSHTNTRATGAAAYLFCVFRQSEFSILKITHGKRYQISGHEHRLLEFIVFPSILFVSLINRHIGNGNQTRVMDKGYIEGRLHSGLIKARKSFTSVCWGELSCRHRSTEREMWNHYPKLKTVKDRIYCRFIFSSLIRTKYTRSTDR